MQASHDVRHRRSCTRADCVGIGRVVGDVRVQVAVARVEHVAHVTPWRAPIALDRVRAPRAAWCAARRRPAPPGRASDAAHRTERLLAPLPQSRALLARRWPCAPRARRASAAARRRARASASSAVSRARRPRPAARRRRRAGSRRRRSEPPRRECVDWSIISSAAGTMPVAMIAETARAASARSAVKSASSVRTASGIGSRRTLMSVAIPKHPSLPTNRPHRS